MEARDRPLGEDRPRVKILPRCLVDENGCWIWTGALSSTGYGAVRWEGRIWNTHRLLYIDLVGEVPKELTMDHLCRNRACCNPQHLEPVTQRVNILRGRGVTAENIAKDACVHGHRFTVEITIIEKTGGRHCKTCREKHIKAWRERNRDRVNASQQRRRDRARANAG